MVRWEAGAIPSSRCPVRDSLLQEASLLMLVPTLDQVRAGTVDIKFVDETVKSMLRTKFALGLFEST